MYPSNLTRMIESKAEYLITKLAGKFEEVAR
jgi:hypothetical protein